MNEDSSRIHFEGSLCRVFKARFLHNYIFSYEVIDKMKFTRQLVHYVFKLNFHKT